MRSLFIFRIFGMFVICILFLAVYEGSYSSELMRNIYKTANDELLKVLVITIPIVCCVFFLFTSRKIYLFINGKK